jgi:hypothetical protein
MNIYELYSEWESHKNEYTWEEWYNLYWITFLRDDKQKNYKRNGDIIHKDDKIFKDERKTNYELKKYQPVIILDNGDVWLMKI